MDLSSTTSLIELFDRLGTPATSGDGANRYMTTPIAFSDTYRLGKNLGGAPALLIQSSPDRRSNTSPIRLQHLYVVHDVDCVVHGERGTKSGKFSVISCVEADRTIEIHFLHVIEALLPVLGEHPNTRSINQAIDQLVELFRALRRSPIKTTQGLWAELFLLSESRDPTKLVDAWHTVPEDLYDFNDSDHRIEVKSTRGDTRRHRFSLAQLQPPAGTILVIASVIVKRAGEGTTINDLIENLRSRLSKSPHHLLRLYKVIAMTLGDGWRESALETFDLPAAKHSLAFFRPSEVPMVNPDIPAGVSDVRFLSDLTGRTPYSDYEAHALGGLVAASMLRGR